MTSELVVSHLVGYHAKHHPSKRAFVFCSKSGEDIEWTWAEVYERVQRINQLLLERGLTAQDHVTLVLSNSVSFYLLYLALMQLGIVAVPVSPLLSAHAIHTLAVKAESRVVIADRVESVDASTFRLVLSRADIDQVVFARHLIETGTVEPLNQVCGDSLCHIFFSSGTTGLPKGIALSHRTRFFYGLANAQKFNICEQSVIMHSGSIVFNGAYVTLMPHLYLGTTFVLLESFSAATFCRAAIGYDVTHCICVPTQIIQVVNSPDVRRLPLQCLISVGAPLPLTVKEQVERVKPGILWELYGLTEGLTTVLSNADFQVRPNSVGRTLPYDRLRICDKHGRELPVGNVGEICGRTLMIFDGYYGDPKRTKDTFTHDGWLRTGDLGRVDEQGFLYLCGRSKDMLISGGVNVYPQDIESVIAQHPNVAECAVFGVDDDKWGETPIAAVRLRSQGINEADLKTWINKRVDARYERVSDVWILHHRDFPRNAASKIVKSTLKKEYLIKTQKSKL